MEIIANTINMGVQSKVKYTVNNLINSKHIFTSLKKGVNKSTKHIQCVYQQKIIKILNAIIIFVMKLKSVYFRFFFYFFVLFCSGFFFGKSLQFQDKLQSILIFSITCLASLRVVVVWPACGHVADFVPQFVIYDEFQSCRLVPRNTMNLFGNLFFSIRKYFVYILLVLWCIYVDVVSCYFRCISEHIYKFKKR